uniref:Protein kinase domain-containing protein n=1 Tax=Timspurckia oligopyrenoides TaxID=708627 RepID=A0A7S0ZAV4_9RHOD
MMNHIESSESNGRLKWDASSESILGAGNSSVVYSGTFDGEPVAIKQLRVAFGRQHQFTQELTIYPLLRNPNIVQCLALSSTNAHMAALTQVSEGTPLLILEKMNGGTLYDNLLPLKHAGRFVQCEHAFRIIVHIAKALLYIHNENIVHGDVRSSNVFLSEHIDSTTGALSRNSRAKLGDFGISKASSAGFQAAQQPPAPVHTGLRGGAGGCFYHLAPELFRGTGQQQQHNDVNAGQKCDIYAFGILIWELLSAEVNAFGNNSLVEVYRRVCEYGERPKWSARVLVESSCEHLKVLHDIAERCWLENVRLRPSSAEIVTELLRLVVNPSNLKCTQTREQRLTTQESVQPMIPNQQILNTATPFASHELSAPPLEEAEEDIQRMISNLRVSQQQQSAIVPFNHQHNQLQQANAMTPVEQVEEALLQGSWEQILILSGEYCDSIRVQNSVCISLALLSCGWKQQQDESERLKMIESFLNNCGIDAILRGLKLSMHVQENSSEQLQEHAFWTLQNLISSKVELTKAIILSSEIVPLTYSVLASSPHVAVLYRASEFLHAVASFDNTSMEATESIGALCQSIMVLSSQLEQYISTGKQESNMRAILSAIASVLETFYTAIEENQNSRTESVAYSMDVGMSDVLCKLLNALLIHSNNDGISVLTVSSIRGTFRVLSALALERIGCILLAEKQVIRCAMHCMERFGADPAICESICMFLYRCIICEDVNFLLLGINAESLIDQMKRLIELFESMEDAALTSSLASSVELELNKRLSQNNRHYIQSGSDLVGSSRMVRHENSPNIYQNGTQTIHRQQQQQPNPTSSSSATRQKVSTSSQRQMI